ncbi:suppressor of fused domain protein [Paenibacillus aestuarii]|uniref:Suppressor of fused domain protein n=1 Tax=Paenibacillus aestuarii TaxID=516965 RepID=A0ABW0K2S9_9BACL|nr:suppressor of fused domain protein [Paenibacillus aestuarii]
MCIPKHYGTDIHSRSIFGANEYLDGFNIYQSSNGYKHILTYGMSELYTDEESFGGEWSRWGYEMTFKLNEESTDNCLWSIDMLSNLARYTYAKKRVFEPLQFISGNGKSINTIGKHAAFYLIRKLPFLPCFLEG